MYSQQSSPTPTVSPTECVCDLPSQNPTGQEDGVPINFAVGVKSLNMSNMDNIAGNYTQEFKSKVERIISGDTRMLQEFEAEYQGSIDVGKWLDLA